MQAAPDSEEDKAAIPRIHLGKIVSPKIFKTTVFFLSSSARVLLRVGEWIYYRAHTLHVLLCCPSCVSKADIDRKVQEIPIEVDTSQWGGATLVTHPINTNGIVHVNVLLDLTSIPFDDIHLLPLFQRMVMETGS